MSVGSWLPPGSGGTISPVRTSAARVTAADPGAFLDGEPWTFTITFTDPGTSNPTDLTGSRLFVQFCYGNGFSLDAIQTCDSAAGDGSIVIAPGATGQATFNAYPEARAWNAPFLGQGLIALPALVYGDVYRQLGNADPVGLTRLTLRVLPSTGAPQGIAPEVLIGQIPFSGGITGGLTALNPAVLTGSVAGSARLAGSLTISPVVSLSGAIPAGAAILGSLTTASVTPVALTGSIAASPALTGALSAIGANAITGTIPGAGTLAGSLSVAIGFTGTVQGGGALTGAMTTVAARPISGAIAAPAGPTGGLSVAGTYAGTVTGGGALTGSLSVAIALSGTIPGNGTLAGAMTTVASTNLNGTVPRPAGPQGSLTTAPGLVSARKGRLAAASAA